MTDAIVRRRLDRLAALLRQFGVVDRFGLSALLCGEQLPSRLTIIQHLHRNAEAFPPSISAEYLADVLLAELGNGETDPKVPSRQGTSAVAVVRTGAAPLTTADGDVLRRIATGQKDAGRYPRHVCHLLEGLFAGQLVEPSLEVDQYGGRSRIDILFRNAANTGFFADLKRVHGIAAPYIPIECKNYSTDPKNPEFEQLFNRFDPKLGAFGILACRTLTDPTAALDRRAAAANKGHWVVMLTDADFRAMLAAYMAGDAAAVEMPLYTQLRALALR